MMRGKQVLIDALGFVAPAWVAKRRAKQFAEGIIRIYRVPDGWSEAENAYWWLPETDGHGKLLRPARLSEREKQRYLVAEHANLITNGGRTQVLTFLGSQSGTTPAFTQFFAIGTGGINAVSPTDTALANEFFRKAPTTYTVQGTQVDIQIQLGTTDAQATYTNVGIFGVSATSTLGSGTLMTHSLFSFTKGAYAINIDYIINLL